MSRQAVRELKRVARLGATEEAAGEKHVLAKEAALSLLDRSINFRHARLAVIRLAMAVKAGAEVPTTHWDYCRRVVADSPDPTLHALLAEAIGTLHQPTPH